MSRTWFVVWLLAGAAWMAPAQAQLASVPAPTLTVELQPTAVTIGDRVEATLRLEAGRGLAGAPRFPFWEKQWGDAEVLRVDPPSDHGGGIWTQHLELALFTTGQVTLPAVDVEVPSADATTTATSSPATVQVDSVLPTGEEEVAPQPPAPVVALPAGSLFWWTAVALGLALLVLAFFALRGARRIQAALTALALSPLEAFEKALGTLRAEASVERVYTGLSLELRRYLGRALGFPAAEGTTTQIQRHLRERQLPTELVSVTLGLLREADQIKFARGEADRQRADRRLDDAERLAGGVEGWLAPVVEDTEAVA